MVRWVDLFGNAPVEQPGSGDILLGTELIHQSLDVLLSRVEPRPRHCLPTLVEAGRRLPGMVRERLDRFLPRLAAILLLRQLLDAIAKQRAADRPDRFEPRTTKRRPKYFNRLTKPRKEINLDIIK
jgi:hypothetical protein